ncbi:MAG: hypothetical protein WCI79_00875 [Candidatus Saccharibacteria bacterium]
MNQKSKKQKTRKNKSVATVWAKFPVVRHLRLITHKHTGKVLHHRHTSHISLLIILLIVGLFLLACDSMSRALQVTNDVTVTATVAGSAPTVGATISAPVSGVNLVDQNLVEVSGTCGSGLFVVVKNNGQLAGSTICTSAGIFVLQVQLHSGNNTINALNYDSLNQPGPITPVVVVYLTVTAPVFEPAAPAPELPSIPSITPGVLPDVTGCDVYKLADLSVGGEVRVAVVCIPRTFAAGQSQTIGFFVWGGAPPYAVSIDWGDDSADTLLSLPNQIYKTEAFSYDRAGVYNIVLRVRDADGREAVVQAAVQVTGQSQNLIGNITDDILHKSWFETPVPFYLLAVAITLGFWGGDIFDRKFGAGKNRRRGANAA